MDKYLVYVRKSSEAEDRQVLSNGSQIKELQLLANKLNVQTINPPLQESMSAKAPGRPVFNEMMQRLYAGEAKGIICWKLDRLARNPVDGGSIIWAIKEKNFEIITPAQTFNQQNENSILLYIEFGMAQKFVDDLSKNVKRGLKTKAENGWLPSGSKPGYANDKYGEKGNKKVPVDELRFPLIRKAWDLMLTGVYTPTKILQTLNDEWGYRTPKHRKIGGKPMCRSMIYKVFTDPFYYGKYEYPEKSGIWYSGKHKQMITKDEFERVQQLLGRKGRPRPKTRNFDYTGLFNCGECGASITAEEKFQIICPNCRTKFASQKKDACPKCSVQIEEMIRPTLLHYIYYHCTKRKKQKCFQKSIQVGELEKQVDFLLSNIQISERFKNWAIKYINELNDKEVDDRNVVLGSLQGAYNDCVKRIDNLVQLKISPQNSNNELLSDDEFKNQKDILMTEKKRLSDKLGITDERIDKWVERAEKAFNFACYARHWFLNGDVTTRKEILIGIGSNLVINNKTVLVELEKTLHYLKDVKDEVPEISPMFEPEKEGYTTAQLEAFYSKNPTLLPG